jgi:hypothetical protein
MKCVFSIDVLASPQCNPRTRIHVAWKAGSNKVDAMQAFGDPTVMREDLFAQPVPGLHADRVWPTERDMKARFPQLELHKIPGAIPFLMLEKPEPVNPASAFRYQLQSGPVRHGF